MAGYRGLGVGGAIVWRALRSADVLGTVDPNGLANGAVTDSGGRLQIPISFGTNTFSTLAAAYLLRFALPTNLLGSGPKALLTRVTYGAKPASTAAGAGLGLYDSTAGRGIAPGLRHRTATGQMRPILSTHAVGSEGVDVSATALTAHGAISCLGSFDGVDNSTFAAWVAQSEGADSRVLSNDVSGLITAGDTEVVLAITNWNSPVASETLDVLPEYAVVDLA